MVLGFRLAGATLAALVFLPAAAATAQVRVPSVGEMKADVERARQIAEADKPRSVEERTAKARAILEDNLVNYSRAKVRGMHIVETTVDARGKLFLYISVGTKLTTVCGEVNAPNRMGGMTGWKKTAIIVEGRDAAPLVTEDPYLAAYLAACPSGLTGEDVTAALQPVAN